MSTTNTLDPVGDSLYNDKAWFTNLEAKASPLPHGKELGLRNLLHLVRIILTHTTLPLPQSKVLPKMEKTAQRTESWDRDDETMHSYANSIGKQIALQDGRNDTEKTLRILETDPEIPLKTKAVLSLVAFATMYGRLRLAALVETNQLAKSITLLKRQPNVGAQKELIKWFEDISTVIMLTLDVADGIMDLKETQPFSNKQIWSRKPMLLSTAVYRIINILVICWSQMVNILIKRNWKDDIVRNKCILSIWIDILKDKRGEIEEELGKEKTQRQTAEVIKVESQNEKMPERGNSSLNCWWKLRQMFHPTTVTSRRPSMLLYTANHSLPNTHTMSSTSQGALPMDKEAAESSSSG